MTCRQHRTSRNIKAVSGPNANHFAGTSHGKIHFTRASVSVLRTKTTKGLTSHQKPDARWWTQPVRPTFRGRGRSCTYFVSPFRTGKHGTAALFEKNSSTKKKRMLCPFRDDFSTRQR